MPRYRVDKLMAHRGKLESGVKVGRVWVKVGVWKRRAVAERIAQNLRQDLPDNRIRVEEVK